MNKAKEPICRVCLKNSIDYIDFDTPFEDEHERCEKGEPLFTYLDCFKKCTNLDVGATAECIAQSFCDACSVELKIAYDFLKKAEKADRILNETILRLQEDALNAKLQHSNEHDEVMKVSEQPQTEDEDSDIESSYECEVCDLEFSLYSTWMKHIQSVHNVKIDSTKRNSSRNFSKRKKFASNYVENLIEIEPLDKSYEYESEFVDFNAEKVIEYEVVVEPELKQTETNDETTKDTIEVNIKMYPCTVCFIEFRNQAALRKHLILEHSKIVKCEICEHMCKEFRLIDHMQKNHKDTKYYCDICTKPFLTKTLLINHIMYHGHEKSKKNKLKSDACEICGKKFCTQNYLRQHMEVHLDTRDPFPCEKCGKIYRTKNSYENHMRIHRGATIQCEFCGKHFPRQYELKIHLRFHTRIYPFKCDICGKKFAIKGHLRSHMWHHQGLKLKCDECEKLFKSSKALLEHSFSHTEMPYPCNHCNRGYPCKQKLKEHLRKAHQIMVTDAELKMFRKPTNQHYQRKKLTLVKADGKTKRFANENSKNLDKSSAKQNIKNESENFEELTLEIC